MPTLAAVGAIKPWQLFILTLCCLLPTAAAIGAGIGVIAGVLSAPVFKVYDSLMDRFFRSKSAVRERRRGEVRSQLLPIIEAMPNGSDTRAR